MSAADIKFNIAITGNPLFDGVILKVLGIVAGGLAVNAGMWLKNHGFDLSMIDPDVLKEAIVGGLAIPIVIVVGWMKNKQDIAKAAQGGINLVLSGEAVNKDGTAITSIGAPGATPPLPVTSTTGMAIMKLAELPKA